MSYLGGSWYGAVSKFIININHFDNSELFSYDNLTKMIHLILVSYLSVQSLHQVLYDWKRKDSIQSLTKNNLSRFIISAWIKTEFSHGGSFIC